MKKLKKGKKPIYTAPHHWKRPPEGDPSRGVDNYSRAIYGFPPKGKKPSEGDRILRWRGGKK